MLKSPLRYPGGKQKVLDLIAPFWTVPHKEYREPFLGGGNVFLAKPKASVNWLNDADKGVAYLWTMMADQDSNHELRRMVLANTPPTVEQWRMWRELRPTTALESAFRTLFLNRTCFSGVLDANPIGGINQTGPVGIAGRWNANALCRQIEASYHKLLGVKITSLDFEEVVAAPGRNVFMYLDPPYYHKGNLLYRACMQSEDHERLARLLKGAHHRFMLTYDDCREVRALYSGAYLYERSWFYSTEKVVRKRGNELFISNFPIVELRQTTLF